MCSVAYENNFKFMETDTHFLFLKEEGLTILQNKEKDTLQCFTLDKQLIFYLSSES